MSVGIARQVEIAQRRAKAVQLRLAGLTYAAIAEQLGYASPGAASKDVTRALAAAAKAQHESSEQLLQLEIDRLDRLMAGLWPAAIGGDVKAVEAVERIIGRRCALLGLDLIHRNGAGDGDVVSLLGSLFASLQARYRHELDQVPAVDVEVLGETGESMLAEPLAVDGGEAA